MNKKGVSTLKVAATYTGTVVGAGFATGQEIFQFFTRFGAIGLAGLLVATAMFIVFGYIIMDLGKKLHANSHMEIIMYSGGNKIGVMIDAIITVFLFGSFTAMIAGTGALFTQQFNFSLPLGNILMAVITALTVMTGINGVINSISFVVPFLLITVIGTSIFSFINAPPNLNLTASVANPGTSGIVNNWFMAAILYVSYNIILSVAVLGPLGMEAKNREAVRNGAILGGLGLGLGSIMIYLTLTGSISEISNLDVPMIFVAGKISSTMQSIYSLVLIAEVYTTAVGSLYGFTSRIIDIKKNPFKGRLVISAITIAALLASQFGFTNFVKYLYPIVGYGGIVLLICLTYSKSDAKRLNNKKN